MSKAVLRIVLMRWDQVIVSASPEMVWGQSQNQSLEARLGKPQVHLKQVTSLKHPAASLLWFFLHWEITFVTHQLSIKTQFLRSPRLESCKRRFPVLTMNAALVCWVCTMCQFNIGFSLGDLVSTHTVQNHARQESQTTSSGLPYGTTN